MDNPCKYCKFNQDNQDQNYDDELYHGQCSKYWGYIPLIVILIAIAICIWGY